MIKLILFIIGLGILIFAGYKYFKLDQNAEFQRSLKAKDAASAEAIIKDVVSNQLQIQAQKFFYDHNNYFISKSNNICVSMQSKFDALKKVIDNPVECVANVHTFTARIKLPSDKYYCADNKGFYTTELEELGYSPGIKCK